MQKVVVADAQNIGIKILDNESYTAATATDLSPLILRLKALNPDIVIASSYANDSILFVKQSKELGLNYKALIGVGAGYGLPDFQKGLGKDADGVLVSDFIWGVNPQGLDANTQAVYQEFYQKYKAKYGSDPMSMATYGFTGAWCLYTQVLPMAGSFDPDKVRAAAMAIDAPNTWINGCGVKFGPDGQNQDIIGAAFQWQNGQEQLVYPQKYANKPATNIPLLPWSQRQ